VGIDKQNGWQGGENGERRKVEMWEMYENSNSAYRNTRRENGVVGESLCFLPASFYSICYNFQYQFNVPLSHSLEAHCSLFSELNLPNLSA